jgi:hypothetical protein
VPSRDALLATQSAVHSVIMGDLSIEHVLPLCLHHLKSAHIPSGTPSRSSDRTLHETYAVSCLQLVLTHGPPNGPADPADDRPLSLQHGVRERQLMIAAASDVWAWLAYYAARLLAFPDLGAVDWAAGALKTVCGGLLLFEDAAFRGQPEAAYVVLVLWVGSERGEPAARDIIRKAMFDPLVDGHRVMLLVLQAAEQHPERSEDLAFAAAVALARLKRQPRDNPEQLERLMTLLAVINKLCRVPEFRAHETLLSPNSIKEIMRVLDLLLPPKGVTEHANATLSRLVSTGIQLCTGFLQFAFLQRNCRATWIAEAVDGGLLVTLHRAEPWMSAHARETDKYTLRPAKGRLGRLLEEGVLTHMWNVHVCGAVDSALRKMLRDYAFRLEDIDPRLVRLHSRWNGYNVDAITSSAFSMEPHCHYSKVCQREVFAQERKHSHRLLAAVSQLIRESKAAELSRLLGSVLLRRGLPDQGMEGDGR